MEVGAPAGGIELAANAKALTPRHNDLEAGFRARGSSLRRLWHYKPLVAAG